MSDITFTSKLSVTLSGATCANTVTGKDQDAAATADNNSHLTQDVGTDYVLVNAGDVDNSSATGDEWVLRLANNSPGETPPTVNVYVKLTEGTPDTYKQIGIMRPGEPWGPARLPKEEDADHVGGIYLKASAAGAKVEVVAGEAGDPSA